MGGRPRRALRGRAVLVAAVAAALVTVVVSPAPAGAGVLTVSPTGTFIVKMRGNGHGHGMSQYGARGAAIVGKSYQQILAFYYAGTTLTTLPPRTLIRVRLSGVGTTTTVAPYSDLVLTGVAGKLPATGVKRYRLVADATTGLTLQQLKSATGAKWTVFKTGLPNRAEFHRTGYGAARVYATDATSSDYYGFLRAVRAKATGTSGGVSTVDVVTLDRYTAGVIPQEMPTSWQRPAVDAQAVAARTYGRYAVEHPQGVEYDICDTTQCQVYGGHANYDASGVLLSTDFQPAATDTANKVLTYHGTTIFAQFSASDGGWSVDGGQPYLKAVADPYDTTAAGDPYINYTKVVHVASIAHYYGLKTVTKIAITQRDGNGIWGGRTLVGVITGTDSAHKPKSVPTTGFGLQAAFGVGTTWFELLADN